MEKDKFVGLTGFVRSPGEKPTAHFRTYRKELAVEGRLGFELIEEQDTGATDGVASTRFLVGVGLNEAWRRTIALTDLEAEWGPLVVNRGYGFDKRSLFKEGYGRIIETVRRLENEGFFQGKFFELMAEYDFGRWVADLVLERLRKEIPLLEFTEDKFDKKEGLLFKMGKRRVQMRNFVHGVGVEVGNFSVWFPVQTTNQAEKAVVYDVGDKERAVEQVDLAIKALKEYLAKK